MKNIIIIGEGQTEEEFTNDPLAAYFKSKGIPDVKSIIMETSPGFRGGSVTYNRLKQNVQNLLSTNPNTVVTTLIDFFRLEGDFPDYAASHAIGDAEKTVDNLEQAIKKDITDS